MGWVGGETGMIWPVACRPSCHKHRAARSRTGTSMVSVRFTWLFRPYTAIAQHSSIVSDTLRSIGTREYIFLSGLKRARPLIEGKLCFWTNRERFAQRENMEKRGGEKRCINRTKGWLIFTIKIVIKGVTMRMTLPRMRIIAEQLAKQQTRIPLINKQQPFI